MERFEDKVAVALVAFCASGSMIAVIVDPSDESLMHAQIIFVLLGIYVFQIADPEIVINFYRNLFRIAWNRIF